MATTWPEMKSDFGLAKNSTKRATSTGWPRCFKHYYPVIVLLAPITEDLFFGLPRR
jgi:hypothetical protein